jgi:hypothetical protein
MSTYTHPTAGTVYRVHGVTIKSDSLAGRDKIHLYRVGAEIHEIRRDSPQGVVTIQPYDEAVQGWGLDGPLVKVVSPSGLEIIIEKSDIEKIK